MPSSIDSSLMYDVVYAMPRAEVAGVAGGEADLGGELRHRRAGQHDRRLVDRVDQLAGTRPSVVDDRKPVQQRAAEPLGLVDAFLRGGELLVARVAVGRRRHDVGEAVACRASIISSFCIASVAKPPRGCVRQRRSAMRAAHRIGEPLVRRQRLVPRDRRVEVDVGAGGPAREVRLARIAGTRRAGIAASDKRRTQRCESA